MANEQNLHNGKGKGRPPGSGNILKKESIDAICDELGFSAPRQVINTALGIMACGNCIGYLQTKDGEQIFNVATGEPCIGPTGKTRYMLTDKGGSPRLDENGDPTFGMRTCQSCYGSLFEHVDPNVRIKASGMILDKTVPSLKQIDHVSTDGSTRKIWEIVEVPSPVEVEGHSQSPTMLQAPMDGFGD